MQFNLLAYHTFIQNNLWHISLIVITWLNCFYNGWDQPKYQVHVRTYKLKEYFKAFLGRKRSGSSLWRKQWLTFFNLIFPNLFNEKNVYIIYIKERLKSLLKKRKKWKDIIIYSTSGYFRLSQFFKKKINLKLFFIIVQFRFAVLNIYRDKQ